MHASMRVVGGMHDRWIAVRRHNGGLGYEDDDIIECISVLVKNIEGWVGKSISGL